MMSGTIVAQSILLIGIAVLIGSLVNIRQIVVQLPTPYVRRRWLSMAGLILIFIGGYGVYARTFPECSGGLADFLVPGLFFLSACFIWLSTLFALQTTKDLLRISRLEDETFRDPLTGAYNRRGMEFNLQEAVEKVLRLQRNLSILMIDLDNFKRVNDEYGHQVGDDVLRRLSSILNDGLRETDLLARYGGEEFLVIAPDATLLGAQALGERLRSLVEAAVFDHVSPSGESFRLPVTVSIGVSSFQYSEAMSEASMAALSSGLIHHADQCLYRAKRNGKNRVEVASERSLRENVLTKTAGVELPHLTPSGLPHAKLSPSMSP